MTYTLYVTGYLAVFSKHRMTNTPSPNTAICAPQTTHFTSDFCK